MKDLNLKTRLFYTTGKQDIIEEDWDKPEIKDNEIEVKSALTGICRSDIDMYCGTFQTLPKYIQGHESIGIVTKVGKGLHNIKEGDFVATRGEPAFADYYNCPEFMYVKIPELSPKWIIEPIACGVNIAKAIIPETADDILILGSGFLASIVYATLNRRYGNKFIVVGRANREFWKEQSNVELSDVDSIRNKKFMYVIDLSDKPEYLALNNYAECATIALAAEKHPKAETSFAEFLWNAVNVKFPSPRNKTFHSSMEDAVMLIESGKIDTSNLWTKSYTRNTEVKLGFTEGVIRPHNYSRGYIEWQK